eukprot:28870-Rhodomonas_salina.1
MEQVQALHGRLRRCLHHLYVMPASEAEQSESGDPVCCLQRATDSHRQREEPSHSVWLAVSLGLVNSSSEIRFRTASTTTASSSSAANSAGCHVLKAGPENVELLRLPIRYKYLAGPCPVRDCAQHTQVVLNLTCAEEFQYWQLVLQPLWLVLGKPGVVVWELHAHTC